MKERLEMNGMTVLQLVVCGHAMYAPVSVDADNGRTVREELETSDKKAFVATSGITLDGDRLAIVQDRTGKVSITFKENPNVVFDLSDDEVDTVRFLA